MKALAVPSVNCRTKPAMLSLTAPMQGAMLPVASSRKTMSATPLTFGCWFMGGGLRMGPARQCAFHHRARGSGPRCGERPDRRPAAGSVARVVSCAARRCGAGEYVPIISRAGGGPSTTRRHGSGAAPARAGPGPRGGTGLKQ